MAGEARRAGGTRSFEGGECLGGGTATRAERIARNAVSGDQGQDSRDRLVTALPLGTVAVLPAHHRRRRVRAALPLPAPCRRLIARRRKRRATAARPQPAGR